MSTTLRFKRSNIYSRGFWKNQKFSYDSMGSFESFSLDYSKFLILSQIFVVNKTS